MSIWTLLNIANLWISIICLWVVVYVRSFTAKKVAMWLSVFNVLVALILVVRVARRLLCG